MSGSAQIRVLPDHVANKIAAGEVVERPASVVKELLENALDAGAAQIDVEIAAGGRKLIRVSDNGQGMSRDDAVLSVERHATSKIATAEDIEHIATLGFRGEALAAIASVSRFRMTTCRAGEASGTELRMAAGKLLEVCEIGVPAGTRVEVRDLFYNIPARRKFLRSYPTELGHVRQTVLVQALARPGVGLTLKVDGRETCALARDDDLKTRLAEWFGPEYVKRLRPVEHTRASIRLHGFVGLPLSARSDRQEQFLFVNGRVSSAPLIHFAIQEAYRTLLPSGRHPALCLFIELDPAQVDVNVHPTKREVRFRNPADLRDALIAAIRCGLDAGSSASATVPAVAPPAPLPAAEAQLKIEDLPSGRVFRYPRLPWDPGDSRGPQGGPCEIPARPSEAEENSSSAAAPWSWCRILGQIGGLYVVLETQDGLVLMDPHAAHERVLYERMFRLLGEGAVPSQALLVPETVELMPAEASRIRENLDAFRDLGFGLAGFGGDTFVVDAVPAVLGSTSLRLLLAEAVSALQRAGLRGAKGRWREEAILRAACRAAVKARDRLSLEEIESLVADLSQTAMPYTCPHGRPTVILWSFRDLNRKFARD